MASPEKVLDQVLRGTSDANIRFNDLCALLRKIGFVGRTRGSHPIFARDGVEEILNLQPKGDKAKHIRSNRFVMLF